MTNKNLGGNHVNATLNILPVMVWICDADGRFVFFNQQYLQFTGNSLADEVNFGDLKSIHKNDLNNLNTAL